MPQTLLPVFPAESTPISDVVSFEKRDGTVWYFHGCVPVFSHGERDYESFSMFTSQIVVMGLCKQVDVVKAFGVSIISVKRHVKKYREEGPGAFFKRRREKRPTVWKPEVLNRAQELFNEDKTRKEVEELLGIKRDTLYRAIRSGRLVEHKKKADKAKVNEA
jgi:transposase